MAGVGILTEKKLGKKGTPFAQKLSNLFFISFYFMKRKKKTSVIEKSRINRKEKKTGKKRAKKISKFYEPKRGDRNFYCNDDEKRCRYRHFFMLPSNHESVIHLYVQPLLISKEWKMFSIWNSQIYTVTFYVFYFCVCFGSVNELPICFCIYSSMKVYKIDTEYALFSGI